MNVLYCKVEGDLVKEAITLPDFIPAPEGYIVGPPDTTAVQIMSMYRVSDMWLERPKFSDPGVRDLEGGGVELVWSDPPEGSVATVVDLDAEVEIGQVPIEDGEIVVTLPEPARYSVTVSCPPLWMDYSITLDPNDNQS